MNVTTIPEDVSIDNSIVYPPAAFVWKICSPILIVMGTISNTLSLIVFSRPNMHSNNTVFYMMILAIGDILVLNVGLLRKWIKYTFDYDIRSYSEFACKGHAYAVHFLLHFTTWTLVAATIDRCMCVCRPFTSKRFGCLRNARFTLPAIGIFLLLMHIFFIIGVKLENENGKIICLETGNIDWKTWSWFDIGMFCFIPFTIMVVCDICITRKIAASTRKVSKYGVTSGNTSKGRSSHNELNKRQKDDSSMTTDTFLSDKSKELRKVHRKATTFTANSNYPSERSKKRQSNLTAMLLAISCAYLVLTIPIGVRIVTKSVIQSMEIRQLTWAIANILRYTNNVIHFFLYCLTGSKFRGELLKICRC